MPSLRTVHLHASVLLLEGFDDGQGQTGVGRPWKLNACYDEGFAFGALEDGILLGWNGGLPQYDGQRLGTAPHRPQAGSPSTWRRSLRGMHAFDDQARRRGALTLTLGTDVHGGRTVGAPESDLYRRRLRSVDRWTRRSDASRCHAIPASIAFNGYVVTGIMSDANGTG